MQAIATDEQLVQPAATFAVFGNPVKHSKSPLIHSAFAKQFDDLISYRAVSVDLDDFEGRVQRFFAAGGAGLNVTVPFKERAFRLADEASDRAQRARAANVLIPLPDGRIRADNTDGIGMVRDMVANHGWQLAGRRTLILGAGGAVRGVLQPLLQEQPAEVVIANRTAAKAAVLADEFADVGVPIRACALADIDSKPFDLIINGTSAGLTGDLPALPELVLSDRCCCYDMVYASEPTPFCRWAASHAAWAVSDGLGMLVEQAAESYYHWQHKRPETSAVIRHLRELITP
jgi:shikimate dehydrogenase